MFSNPTNSDYFITKIEDTPLDDNIDYQGGKNSTEKHSSFYALH